MVLMLPERPASPAALAALISAAADAGKTIALGGAFTKNRMAGPACAEGVAISTAGLQRVLQYDPRDLTISVEAGLPFAELDKLLAADGLMLPLDPPFFAAATVGGVVAANTSGPRRRQYGTARDLVIGMEMATLEGKLIKTGGMVVKNAAGYDVGKLLVGSFGTLAAMTSVNFRLAPRPPHTRTFVLTYDSAAGAVAARDSVLRGVLQPVAMDILNPAAAARLGRSGWLLVLQAGGTRAVLERYSRELPQAATMEGPEEDAWWVSVREFTPQFLAEYDSGAVVRVSGAMQSAGAALGSTSAPLVARAGSGVCYGYFEGGAAASDWLRELARRGLKAVLEFRPESGCDGVEQWPDPGNDLATMKAIKKLFDPRNLLNPGRLYGRL